MEKSFFRRAAWETVRAALIYTVFCLFALAIAAVFVKAYAPSDGAITGICWGVRCVGSFGVCLFLIKGERALFKGLAAGVLGEIFTMLAFAAIGGGFHITAFFPLELLGAALLGGSGALLGAKLRKE